MLLKSYKSNERFLAATSFVRPPQCVDGNSNANFLIMPATTALTHQASANQSYHRFLAGSFTPMIW
jgi:hypothetical protein